MGIKKEIIRSIYEEVKASFKMDLRSAEHLDKEAKAKKTKSKELPFQSFMAKRGASLQFAMGMIYILKRNGIKALLVVYRGEGEFSEKPADHASVVYRDGLGLYIADFEAEDLNMNKPYRIPLLEYRKKRGKLWIYDPYGKNGSLPFFEGFLKKPTARM